MAIAGNLQDMSLPTLIQSIIQDGGQASIELRQNGYIGSLYIADGQLHHAELSHQTDLTIPYKVGEEVVYELLAWGEGAFQIERNMTSPDKTVQQSWDFLLMEGLRQLDEGQANHFMMDEADLQADDINLAEALGELSAADAAVIEALTNQTKGDKKMASKSEIIKSVLQNTINNSSDLLGAVVVDSDGLLLASVLNGSLDGNRIAAVSAGLISLAGRSAQQLGQGNVVQTLIRAENGNIIALRASDRASFVALTSTDANLGMAFIECQDAAAEIAKTL